MSICTVWDIYFLMHLKKVIKASLMHSKLVRTNRMNEKNLSRVDKMIMIRLSVDSTTFINKLFPCWQSINSICDEQHMIPLAESCWKLSKNWELRSLKGFLLYQFENVNTEIYASGKLGEKSRRKDKIMTR